MSNLKIGIGFDVHKLIKGRKLFLGGALIPYNLGLQGHSDADVLLHALTDALLGAMAKPDIGQYFPDTDPKYKNAASTTFLKKAVSIMKQEKFKIVNIDCVVIADEPKINVFRDKILNSISGLISLDKNYISVKAKTTEGLLSFSKKGIAVYCVVLLEKTKRCPS